MGIFLYSLGQHQRFPYAPECVADARTAGRCAAAGKLVFAILLFLAAVKLTETVQVAKGGCNWGHPAIRRK